MVGNLTASISLTCREKIQKPVGVKAKIEYK